MSLQIMSFEGWTVDLLGGVPLEGLQISAYGLFSVIYWASCLQNWALIDLTSLSLWLYGSFFH